MDDLEKKLFAQLDDDMPGVRSNALEALREHLKAAGRTFRDFVADLDAVPPVRRRHAGVPPRAITPPGGHAARGALQILPTSRGNCCRLGELEKKLAEYILLSREVGNG